MTTTVRDPVATAGLGALARLEAVRFARHPLFLVGVTLLAGVVAVSDVSPDVLAHPIGSAWFLGVFGLIVAHGLARSSATFHETGAAAPVPATTRTLALCLACLVPAAVAVVHVVVLLIRTSITPPLGGPWFDTVPALDVWAILLGGSVVAAFGGSVLGVLVARWTRFPAAGLIVAVVLVALVWTLRVVSLGGPTVLQLAGPWVQWTPREELDVLLVVLAAGSPVWYGLYQVCLCGLGVLGALLATPPRDRRLVTAFAGVAVLAGLCLVLAMTTGNPSPVEFRVP